MRQRLGAWILLAAALAIAGVCGAQEVRFDLAIRGGHVIDGTGAPAAPQDLGIRDGRIVVVGDLPKNAVIEQEIDARELVVAPGFIDVHAHADRTAARRGDAKNYVLMGVTTIVTGNCGGSVQDIAAHFAEVERRKISINYASLVGHGTVRRQVLGTANRAPTDEELGQMRDILRAGMEAGACGMSTGLIYVPGTYAKTDELVALCEVVAEFGGVYASHMRNEANRVIPSIEEALEIGSRSGVHVHLSHLKASGKNNWGRGAEIVARLRKARSEGLRLTGDQYAYTASSTGLEVLFPSAELAIGRGAFCEKLGDDEAFRSRMADALRKTAERVGFGDFSYAQIARAPRNQKVNGMRMDAAARTLRGADSLDDQIETILRLMTESKGNRVQMVYHKMSEEDVASIMREPFVAVAADAGIRMYKTADKPHPRGAGNNPRVLGRYVREREVLSLELAIHKMTGLPAEVFQLEQRGTIRVGHWADLVVFDPDTVLDGATYAEPLNPPAGIARVVVNGSIVVQDGEHTRKRPGAVLRHRSR